MLLLFIVDTHAQTVTLGSGATTNGVTTSSPVNIWYRKTVCQTVYTAAELTAAGASAGNINKLGYFVANPPIYNLPGYTIQMKHTTATDASGNLEGGYTTVVNGFTYAPGTNEWDMLTLDTPFAWDGVQNIVVRVCWSQVSPTYDPSGQLRTYTATNGFKYRRSDAGGTYCNDVPQFTLNTKPQIRMIFDTTTTWTGAFDDDWSDQANWSSGVPNATMHATIPTGTPNNPLLTGTGTCKDLTVDGTMSITGTIEIHGDFTNTGTYDDQDGTMIFYGEFTNDINATATTTIDNLEVQNENGVQVLSGSLIIEDELRVVKGNFATNDMVTLRSDALGTARIDEIKTVCVYTLTMNDSWGDGWNGGFITVYESGVPIGTYSGEGTTSTETFSIVDGNDFDIEYTAGSYENENTYTIEDETFTIIFSDGPTPSTGIVFSSTAAGCNFGPVITGDISMERYIDAGETNWRYFSSAVTGATIGQYNDDFVTAGYPGSTFPGFGWVSIYTYDETLAPGSGYLEVTSSAQVIGVGQGLQVWSGDTITGTLPFTVDLQGVPNQGDIAMPVTFTDFSTPTEDGYCQVGNPYASTIDWDATGWTKTNMANATYIQDPDTEMYATYIAGAGANGGSRYVASQQAFWVQAIGTSPVLTAREACKANTDAPFFKSGESSNPGCNIRIDGFGMSDECVVRNEFGTVDAKEYDWDADKLWGAWGVNPQISLVNGEPKDLTVHTFDFAGSEWTVPLRVIVFEDGDYTLEFNNVESLNIPCLKLEDTYDGTMYDIEEGTSLTFTIDDTTWAPRFLMHFGKAIEVTTTATACSNSADGQIEIDLDVSGDVDYTLTWSGGSDSGTSDGDPLLLSDLTSEIYTVTIADFDNLCNVDSFTGIVSSPSLLTAWAEIQEETYGGDGQIEVEGLGGTAPYYYSWSTGETTALITSLEAGTYYLTLTDENDCEWDGEFVVGSAVSLAENEISAKFIYWTDQEMITLTNWSYVPNEVLQLYSLNGTLLTTYTITSDLEQHNFRLPSGLADGPYLLVGLNQTFKFIK